MQDTVLSEIIALTEKSTTDSVRVFFVTREINKDAQTAQKKHNYELYTVDVTNEVREALSQANKEQLNSRIKREYSLVEYDLIMDDEKNIYTYKVESIVSGFKESIYNRIDSYGIKPFPGLGALHSSTKEDLWAYIVEVKLYDGSNYLVLRKITKGKIASDDSYLTRSKSVRTKYDVKDKQLELVEGETINLDKQIDCVLFGDSFYIFKKEKFEQMVGLEDAYEHKAIEVIENIKAENVIEGTSFLSALLEFGSLHHKRLIKIEKIGLYKNLTPEVISKMLETAKKWTITLKLSGSKILIESKEDAEIVVKFLVDYHKESPVTGFRYGTYTGVPIKN